MRGGIWRGSISFGLLNIPVFLQVANQDKDLHFSMLDSKDLSPIRFRRVSAKTGQEVPYKRIVKGYKYEGDHYVVVDAEDFRAANVRATQTIDIEDFVKLDEIDPMLFEKPYYLIPQKGAEKGYALLRDALAKSRKVAIGTFVLRTKQHLAALMPRDQYLILEMMRFSHTVIETSEADYLPARSKSATYSARELKMAEELISDMTSKWQPDRYKDTYYADLMKRIENKIRAGEGKVVERPEEGETARLKPSKPSDLLPLLRQSLESNRGRRREGAGRQSASAATRKTPPRPKAKPRRQPHALH